MNLKELYDETGGDYGQATKVLRLEKLIDKHIRKFPENTVFDDLAEAGMNLDASGLFESAHAIKGLCSNLGFTRLAAVSEELCDEFRPGRERQLTDEVVLRKIHVICDMFNQICQGIQKYEQSNS